MYQNLNNSAVSYLQCCVSLPAHFCQSSNYALSITYYSIPVVLVDCYYIYVLLHIIFVILQVTKVAINSKYITKQKR